MYRHRRNDSRKGGFGQASSIAQLELRSMLFTGSRANVIKLRMEPDFGSLKSALSASFEAISG